MKDRISTLNETSIDDHPFWWSFVSVAMVAVVIFLFAQALA